MFPLFESIRVVDGDAMEMNRHIQRMQNSAHQLWNSTPSFATLKNEIEEYNTAGIQKCKVYYNSSSYKIEMLPYTKRAIEHLHVVVDNEIQYELKYTDRNCFYKHTKHLPLNDDIIILKNNALSDSSYSNLALWNGSEWHTPLHPLFRGIKRSILIEQKIILERNILLNDIQHYEKISLINAMLDLDVVSILVEKIQGLNV